MYKEYRDVTVNGAIDKMYAEMASRHRARKSTIWVVDVSPIPAAKVKRDQVKQFINPNIKFRLYNRVPRPSSKAFRKVYKASKPCTFF
jgi:large subunit ribosomal protein L18Ae